MKTVRWPALKVLWRNPRMLKVRPALNLFFLAKRVGKIIRRDFAGT